MNSKIKALISIIVVIALFLTGTFAWINFAQEITNEWEGGGTPGGTTHDDFCKPKKEVYIENWGSTPLIVRIRLDEYMEIGEGAGLKGTYSGGVWTHNADNHSTSLMGSTTNIDDKSTWQPHIPVTGDPTTCDPSDPNFHDYWKWSMGGWKYYRMAPSPQRETLSYVDQNTSEYNNASGNIKQTLNATVLTMEDWQNMGSPIGNYWVIDTDGWAYWASLLMPGQATGLLLNKVELINDPDDSYYYAINVIAQMATRNKTGTGDNFGNYEDFYSDASGDDLDHSATGDGQDLLDKIANGGSGTGGGNGGIITDKGTLAGDKLFLRQGDTANLTANPVIYGTDQVVWTTDMPKAGFTFNSHNNAAVVKAADNAVIGAKLEITVVSVPSPNKMTTITVIVIDKNAAGVVLGEDGNLYLDWGDNTFNRIDENGNYIDQNGNVITSESDIRDNMICGGMDEKPGNIDDRTDIVFTDNDVKLLGPNIDDSYQAPGNDGKLGTEDDEYWWKKPGKETENVEDLNFPSDFTQVPPAGIVVRNIVISPLGTSVGKGKTQQFTSTVYMTDGSEAIGAHAGVIWSVTPNTDASISSGGLLTINANASASSVIVVAVSTENSSIISNVAIVAIKPDIEPEPTGVDGKIIPAAIAGDDSDWIEIARNGNYSLIVRKNYVPYYKGKPVDDENFVWTQFGPGVYNTSNCEVRKIINNWFTGENAPLVELAANATLREYTVRNTALNNLGSVNQANSAITGISNPKAQPDSDGDDVAFALSFAELVNFCSTSYLNYPSGGNITSTGVAPLNFAKLSIPFSTAYGMWTRSPGEIGRSGAMMKSGYAYQAFNNAGYNMVYPALWVDSAIFDLVP
ncbi:MAG: hypothetical protein FWF92_06380 [Oscillospiraceae bacterium]|nr:hypothetical protein [Oscillospiraceae bacterium]